MAALEANDPGLGVTEDAANAPRRYKSGKTICLPEVSPQSQFCHRESVTDLKGTKTFNLGCKQGLKCCFAFQIYPLEYAKTQKIEEKALPDFTP